MNLPPEPIVFSPLLKRIIWGGRKLGELLGKPLGVENDYAESWELVDRADDQSVVAGGPLDQMTISQLLATYPQEIMGRHATQPNFPLLLKYLDCNRVLSVQVHPDDKYAMQMAKPDLGKTEAWYIVEAQPQSVIYAGLQPGVDRQSLADSIRLGQTESILNRIPAVAGQCIFIPAGTVHALGDGLVVAEVQQSSDTTFRLFDWNRVDASGKARQLHIEESLEVTNYDLGPIRPQTPQLDADGWESLVRCDKFLLRQGSAQSVKVLHTGDGDGPVTLMVTKGTVTLEGKGWERRVATAGQTILLPAVLKPTTVMMTSDDAHVLEIRLP